MDPFIVLFQYGLFVLSLSLSVLSPEGAESNCESESNLLFNFIALKWIQGPLFYLSLVLLVPASVT